MPAQLIELLKSRKGESIIIYCFSRKDTESLADDLNHTGFRAAPYHAGLSGDVRSKTQEKFIRDQTSIIVATIAFGMGIDKPDVRLIIHHSLPKSIEGYYLDEQVDLSFTTEASTILYILWHSDDTDHYPSVRECSAITFDDHIVNNEMVEHGFVTDPDDVIVPGRWQRIEPTSRTYIYFTDVDFIEGAIYHLSVTPGIVSETGKILETGLEYDFNIRIL